MIAYRLHVRGERLVAIEPDAQRQEIDAVPDQQCFAGLRLARHRCGDDDIVSAGQTAEQHLSGAEQRGKQRAALLRGSGFDLLEKIGTQMTCRRGAVEALRLRACAVAGQVELHSRLAMEVQPELARLLVDTGLVLRLGEGEKALHLVELRRLAGNLGRVERLQIAQDDVDRPSVADDVMGGKHEGPLLAFQAHQRGACERSAGEIEDLMCFRIDEGPEFAGCIGVAGKVDPFQRHGRRCIHEHRIADA